MKDHSLDVYVHWRRKNPDLKVGELKVNDAVSRVGRFFVSTPIARQAVFSEVLAKMGFVPYRVEHLFEKKAFEYVGISPIFRELEQSERTPVYTITIKTDKTGEILEVTALEDHSGI